MTDKTALGDRMKQYERATDVRLLPLLPVMVRIDGKTFSSWTRGLGRPYDERLSKLMVATTKHLVAYTGARIGYTQSDEISLVLYSSDPKSETLFDGRVQKLQSVLASATTWYFNREVPVHLPERTDKMALFDCRAWSVPTQEEATNCLLWREQDATRNSISMAAQSRFSHKRLHGLDTKQMQELLYQEAGINWNDYPAFFKRGTYVQRYRVARPFTTTEIEKLPAQHEARKNPDLVVHRSEVRDIDMPPLASIANRVAVVFDGAEPELR